MSFDRMQSAGRYDAHPHVRSMANEGQEWASFAMCRRFFRASERCDVGDVIFTDFGENHRSSFTGIAQPDPSKMNALAREPDEHKVARLTNNKILYVFAVTFFCTLRLYFETGSLRYRIHITPWDAHFFRHCAPVAAPVVVARRILARGSSRESFPHRDRAPRPVPPSSRPLPATLRGALIAHASRLEATDPRGPPRGVAEPLAPQARALPAPRRTPSGRVRRVLVALP